MGADILVAADDADHRGEFLAFGADGDTERARVPLAALAPVPACRITIRFTLKLAPRSTCKPLGIFLGTPFVAGAAV
jgi:hypothetical protein